MDLQIKCSVTLSKDELLEALQELIDDRYKYSSYSNRPIGEVIDCVMNPVGSITVLFGEKPEPPALTDKQTAAQQPAPVPTV